MPGKSRAEIAPLRMSAKAQIVDFEKRGEEVLASIPRQF